MGKSRSLSHFCTVYSAVQQISPLWHKSFLVGVSCNSLSVSDIIKSKMFCPLLLIKKKASAIWCLEGCLVCGYDLGFILFTFYIPVKYYNLN